MSRFPNTVALPSTVQVTQGEVGLIKRKETPGRSTTLGRSMSTDRSLAFGPPLHQTHLTDKHLASLAKQVRFSFPVSLHHMLSHTYTHTHTQIHTHTHRFSVTIRSAKRATRLSALPTPPATLFLSTPPTKHLCIAALCSIL